MRRPRGSVGPMPASLEQGFRVKCACHDQVTPLVVSGLDASAPAPTLEADRVRRVAQDRGGPCCVCGVSTSKRDGWWIVPDPDKNYLEGVFCRPCMDLRIRYLDMKRIRKPGAYALLMGQAQSIPFCESSGPEKPKTTPKAGDKATRLY